MWPEGGSRGEGDDMIREIVELGNPLLRSPSAPVSDPRAPETSALAADLLDTLHDFQSRTGYGRGIAAPQVGELRRMVVIDIPGARPAAAAGPFRAVIQAPAGLAFPLVLVNPAITRCSPETGLVWDACFSYWGFFFQVRRARRVTVDYVDCGGSPRRLEAEGDLAELLQHEIDHLGGVLAIDRIADPKSLCTLREFERRNRNR